MINHTDIEAMKEPVMKHWVKVPGPGEMRGEGQWVDFVETFPPVGQFLSVSAREKALQEEWDYLTITKYLPTQISEEKPE